MRFAALRQCALGLPEVTEEPHHDFRSFRVSGKIFVTVPPDEESVHLFLAEEQREEAIALHADWAEPLFWGGKRVGVRVRLAAANAAVLRELVRAAWENKAPKRLRAGANAPSAPVERGKTSPAAGYSGTPLASKLGLKPAMRLAALDAPADYAAILGELPAGLSIAPTVTAATDLAHLFVTERKVLAARLEKLRRLLRDDAALWVSWPKKASKVPTDVSEDTIRDVALPLGFVDIKVCAVTEVWSGLKLMVRRELRDRSPKRGR